MTCKTEIPDQDAHHDICDATRDSAAVAILAQIAAEPMTLARACHLAGPHRYNGQDFNQIAFGDLLELGQIVESGAYSAGAPTFRVARLPGQRG